MNKIINKGHMGSTIKFLSKEDRILFLKDFYSPCKMNQLFSSWNYKGNYNLVDIKFKEAIVEELVSKKFVDEKIFCKENYKLEKLHLCLNSDNKSLDESEQNKISISFYEISKILNNLYVEFIKNRIFPIFDEQNLIKKIEQIIKFKIC